MPLSCLLSVAILGKQPNSSCSLEQSLFLEDQVRWEDPAAQRGSIDVVGIEAPMSRFSFQTPKGLFQSFYSLDQWAECCVVYFRKVSCEPLRNSRLLIEDFHCASQEH